MSLNVVILGCVALAALLKPLFSFVLSRLPIGNRRPRLNLPYLFSIKKGTKEMDEGDIEDAKKDDYVGFYGKLKEICYIQTNVVSCFGFQS